MLKILARIRYALRNLLLDLHFGKWLAGYKEVRVPGHTWVVNSDYSVLPHIFAAQIREEDVIVEVGCGRGRVLNWLLMQGHKNRLIGIEYDEKTALATRQRLARYKNVEVITADATEFIPPDATLFYLFNPFGTEQMTKFSDNVKRLFSGKRSVRLLYYRPLEIEVFQSDPAWKVIAHEIPSSALDLRFSDKLSHRAFAVIEFVV